MNPVLTPSRKKRLYNQILHLKPVLYLPLDELLGTIALNHAPQNRYTNNGATTAAVPGQPGKVGKAYFFDGVNDKVTFTGITRTAGQPFSVFAVIKPGALVALAKTPLGVRNGSGAGDLWKIGITNDLSLYLYGFEYDPTGSGAAVNSTVSAVAGIPAFICGTYDGDKIRVYVNGLLSNASASLPNAAIDQTLGAIGVRADDDTEDFTGYIQHMAMFDRALSAGEISSTARVAGFA